MQTPYQLESNEEFEHAQVLDIEVYVYSIDDINGEPVEVGLITDWKTKDNTVSVNNRIFDQTKYVFVTQSDIV